MTRKVLSAIAAALLTAGAAAAAPGASPAPHKTLTAFASEQELSDLFKRWAEDYQRRIAERRRAARSDASPPSSLAMEAAPMAAAPAAAGAAKSADESVTNVQHAGVDEGGIVKLHGDYLVVLRRGRLFTVARRRRQLEPVSQADAFGAGIDAAAAPGTTRCSSGGNTIAVIGYSYERGGTEIGLFDISAAGRLRVQRHLSPALERLLLVAQLREPPDRREARLLHAALPQPLGRPDPRGAFPALRKWHAGATQAEFRRIAPATRIYRSDEALDPVPRPRAAHGLGLRPRAGRAQLREHGGARPAGTRFLRLARLGLRLDDGPSAGQSVPHSARRLRAERAQGQRQPDRPVLVPRRRGRHLERARALQRRAARACGRPSPAPATSRCCACRSRASPTAATARPSAPTAPCRAWKATRCRTAIVGPYLLYGAGAGWRRPRAAADGRIYAVDYAHSLSAGAEAYEIPLPHGVDRIEPLGANAVVVGSDGRDLHFTACAWRAFRSRPAATCARTPRRARRAATASSTRRKAKSTAWSACRSSAAAKPPAEQLRKTSASLLFLRNRSLALTELGTLDARAGHADDGCRASCVDWYGNSRPLFLRGRVFALLGYEIVEGRLRGERIAEARRISFAPGQAQEIAD